jgi:1,4-dihydroxy-6-naphthoate synthase
MKFSLGFSPCPNDTFIFDALVNKKIDTEGLEFEVVLEDVETLNQWAYEGRLDISKLSFPSFFQNIDNYILLNSGAALGKGVGPLLISKQNIQHSTFNIQQSSIALPGKNTTANLLFSFAYPDAKNKIFMRFDTIENYVLHSASEASPVEGGLERALGVIIHENRFTYRQKGLYKVKDLGEHWEEKMKTPIPLGGIAIKRTMDKLISLKVEKMIRKSIEFAFANYPLITDYIKINSQEMSEDVMRQHIELYVNDFSVDLGAEGKLAIETLYSVFSEQQALPANFGLSGQMFIS